MSIFKNAFFTAEGQKERLANVRDTLLSAVGIKKGGVQSNTGVKSVDAVLSAAASRPFTTAGVVAVAVAPAAAGAAVKQVASSAGKQFAAAKFTTQAAVVGGGIVGTNVLATSSKAREAVANTPSSLANFGQNVGEFIEDPSLQTAGNIIKENPVVAGVLGVAAVGAAGVGVGTVANIVSTRQNTKAIKENTAVSSSSQLSPLYPPSVAGGSANLAAPVTDSSIPGSKIPGAASQKSSSGRRKRKRKAAEPARISQNVKVYNIDDRDQNDRKQYK